MYHRKRLLFALASLLAGLGASKSQAKAEGLTVSQPETQGTLSVAPAQPQPAVDVAPANTSSTSLPVALEPAPPSAAAPAAELQPATNPQPAAPAPETPAPAAPTPTEAAQPAATPQSTATVTEVQPATGAPAESPPPSTPEASPTATISQPQGEPAKPGLEVAEPQPPPQITVQTQAAPTPNVTVTTATPPAGPLAVTQGQQGAAQVTGQDLQGGPPRTAAAASPAAQTKTPATPLQGSSPQLQSSNPNVQGSDSHGAFAVQPTTAPQEVTGNDKVDLPPASGGTTNAQPPKPADHICTTATFHDLIGGGFRYCTGPSPSLVVIAGIGEGGGVSVDREPADAPSPTLHGELSIGDGLASGGVSGDVPLHGAPSAGANAGVLGFGPSATVTRSSDGSPSGQLGVQGPLSTGKKNSKSSKAKSSGGAKADASVDVEVPLSWRYIQPDTLISPLGHNLYFGL